MGSSDHAYDRAMGASPHGERLAVARIYNRLTRELPQNVNFVWVVEEDILPPVDAAERLLRPFDSGSGVEEVVGNGFGCVMLRTELIRGRPQPLAPGEIPVRLEPEWRDRP